MSTLNAPINLGVPLREAISWVGVFANRDGTEEGKEVAHLCAALAKKHGPDAEITIAIPAVDVLCRLADGLREMGAHEDVETIDKIVMLLKQGQPRVVTATLGFTARTVGELDGKLESIRDRLTQPGV